MAKGTHAEFIECKQNILKEIQNQFSYLISEYNFQITKVEVENSWSLVWYENADRSRKVYINFDVHDLYINQSTYQIEKNGQYTEIDITDMLKQFGADPTYQDPHQLHEILSVEYVNEESYNEFYLRIADKMKVWASIYRESADKILRGEKYIAPKDTTPFWKR
jgi:hypothetical protein